MRAHAQTSSGIFIRQLVVGLTAFLTVIDLFAAQALLPSLTALYGVTPAAMGVAVNACTLGMAIGGLSVAFVGHRIDRRRGIVMSLALLSIPTLLLAIAPNLWTFSVLRVVQGLFMSAAFGLTLSYLGEHFDANEAAGAFAAYITGNVASNLAGRLAAAAVVDHAGLAASFALFASLNLAGAALVHWTVEGMPASSMPRKPTTKDSKGITLNDFSSPPLLLGFGIGFCILFAFIGTFTYINFVLVAPPYSVGMMQLGVIYFVFLPSIFTTPLAGRARDHWGARTSLVAGLTVALAGLPMLLVERLPIVLLGLVLVAAGTFFAQAIATGAVSRAASSTARAAAGGIYLASYFSGGLAGSTLIGLLYDKYGWSAAVSGIGAALIAAILLARRLTDRTPM